MTVPNGEGSMLPLSELKACLHCGSALQPGSIVGQHRHLNWLPAGDRAGLTTWGKEHLATGSFNAGPALQAMRCASCGLGYFAATPG